MVNPQVTVSLVLLLTSLTIDPLVVTLYSDHPVGRQIASSSKPLVHVYYDRAYPNNWLSKDDSIFLVNYLRTVLEEVGVSVVVVDAKDLARLLTEDAVKILIMSQDIAPSDVWTGGMESLLIKWVLAGGILVWSGDVELWYVGYSNGSKHSVGDLTHLLYGSNIVGFLNPQECKVKIDGVPEISKTVLSTYSARPVIGGGHVLEAFGSCVVGGVEYYDPALIRSGKGVVLRVFMTGGETDIVVRAFTIAKLVAGKFLGIEIEPQKLRKASFPRIVIGEYHNWYSTGPSWIHWSWNVPAHWRNPEKIIDGKREIASANYPLIGPYDSRDDRVIEYHIRTAKVSGIDVFAIDWYGPNSYEDSSIRKYLDIAAKLNFKIAIEYEPKIRIEWGSGAREHRINMVISDLRYVLSLYAGHPAYLKVDGKPVIFYFWPSQLRLGEWIYIINKLKEEGFDAIHITEGIDPRLLTTFDCIYEWEPLWIKNVNITAWDRLREVSQILREYSRLYPNKCFLAGVWPGFDSEGVYGWGEGIQKFERLDGKVYEEQWKVVLETNPDMVMITTFNDWNEGTEIEPSLEHGFKYMNLTRTYSRLYKKNEGVTLEYKKPSTSIISSIEGDRLKIILKNSGDIVAVRAEVELGDSYSGNFLSYNHPSYRSKFVAIVPYIGEENYVFTLVLNKPLTNITIPLTITYHDIVGNPYEHKFFIARETNVVTVVKELASKLETTVSTVTLTEKVTETLTKTILQTETPILLSITGLLTTLVIIIAYMLIRGIKKETK